MISVQNLSKSYGSVRAVRDVSFEVRPREVVGFLGPNGAGKSTTLRIIAGFLGASNGRVLVDGHDIVQEPLRARASIGYMPENVPLYPEMRVREYLRFRAELKRVARAQRRDAVERAMSDVRLGDHADVLIGELSKGYRQRVGLADALVARPAVLVLDEPTAGLDPNQIREVRELIRSLAETQSVLLSTHIMSEVEATCDRALVIDRGRLVAQGTLEELRELRASHTARVVVRGDPAEAKRLLAAVDGVERVRKAESSGEPVVTAFDVLWKPGNTASRMETVVAALVHAKLGVREATAAKATLEQVFALLTEDDRRSVDDQPSGPEKEAS
jgi:ABC-2 type transport system ATP-binding protein